jgi:hypothetical protein
MGQTDSVSEIEFCTLYVVAERWILGCILRFMHAKNHFSDTLRSNHDSKSEILFALTQWWLVRLSLQYPFNTPVCITASESLTGYGIRYNGSG